MNGINIGRGVRLTNVDLEIPHTAQEIVLIDILLLVITDIDIGSDDTQTDEARGCQDSWHIDRLLVS